MINIFISVLMSLGLFNIFTITYRLDGINRTIVSAPMEIFEYSIPVAVFDTTEYLVFDVNKVKRKYVEYLDTVIYQYVNDYDVSFSFYTIHSDLVSEKYEGVDITFSTKVTLVNYERTMYYEISEGRNG